MDCLSFKQAKSLLVDKALSNQEMKETNRFTLDENWHPRASLEVNFPDKTCLSNVNQV